MEKLGVLTEDSISDFDPKEKVKFVDAAGPYVAGEKDKHRLTKPVPFVPEVNKSRD